MARGIRQYIHPDGGLPQSLVARRRRGGGSAGRGLDSARHGPVSSSLLLGGIPIVGGLVISARFLLHLSQKRKDAVAHGGLSAENSAHHPICANPWQKETHALSNPALQVRESRRNPRWRPVSRWHWARSTSAEYSSSAPAFRTGLPASRSRRNQNWAP